MRVNHISLQPQCKCVSTINYQIKQKHSFKSMLFPYVYLARTYSCNTRKINAQKQKEGMRYVMSANVCSLTVMAIYFVGTVNINYEQLCYYW